MVEVTGEQYAALAMGTWSAGDVPRRSGRVRFPPLEVGTGAPVDPGPGLAWGARGLRAAKGIVGTADARRPGLGMA